MSNRHLDENVLKNLKALEDPSDEVSFLDDLIETYLDCTPNIINELVTAINSVKPEKIQHYSHKLKGLSRNLGASELSRICQEIEDNHEDIDPNSCRDLIANLETEFRQASAELKANWYHQG